MIILLTGPEGSGKTTWMTYLALMHYAAGGKVLAFQGYDLFWKKERVSEVIKLEQWATYADQSRKLLQDAMVCIDELQTHFDNMTFNSVKSRLFANLLAQRRKLNMTFVFTIQEQSWSYNRVRWLSHVQGDCYDLFWSPWGKGEGIHRGELIRCDFTDLKGFFKGIPGMPMAQINLKSKVFWPCFRSYDPVSPYEGMAKIRVKAPVYDIDLTGQMQTDQMLEEAANTQDVLGVDDQEIDKVNKLIEGNNVDRLLEGIEGLNE